MHLSGEATPLKQFATRGISSQWAQLQMQQTAELDDAKAEASKSRRELELLV